MSEQITSLALQVGEVALKNKLLIATAESCTGGWVAQAITAIPGSSSWFDRGFVTYSNASKQTMLGVSDSTLNQFGAVSEETACEMALGAIIQSNANLSVAITGIAGPSGATEDKPIGTVWIAWARRMNNESVVYVEHDRFDGDRNHVREQAVIAALTGLRDHH